MSDIHRRHPLRKSILRQKKKISDILSDILPDILLRLPAQHVLLCRAVCREWRRLIDDPSFVRSHTNNQLTNSSATTLLIRNSQGSPICLLSLETLSLNIGNRQLIEGTPVQNLIRPGVSKHHDAPLASCNGLMLVSDRDAEMIWAIWNPLTNDCHQLPPHPKAGPDGLTLVGKGLGYDPATDDYKVVCIDFVVGGGGGGLRVFRTFVYSMKSGGWRAVKDCPRPFLGSPTQIFIDGEMRWYSGTREEPEGVLLNGAVHWLAADCVVAFDVGTEDYRQLALPPSCPSVSELANIQIDAIGGSLVLSYSYHNIDRFDGWVMDNYGEEQSWKKLLSLGEDDIGELDVITKRALKPVAYLNGKRQVLLLNFSGFCVVDVEDGSVKNISIHSQGISSAQICPGSILRLGDGGVKRKGRKKKKKAVIRTCRLKFCVRGVNDGYCSDHSCRSDGED